MTKRLLFAVMVAALTLASPAFARPARFAQAGRANRPAAAGDEPAAVTPAEVERMFEAVALVRAQDALQLDDDKYLTFIAKYKALQEARRRTQQERQRLMRELNQLSKDEGGDENQMKDRLKAMSDLEARAEVEIHKAYDAIDQILTVRQQARFRIFEQNMELQKLSLIERAKLQNRQQKKQN